MLRHLFGPGSTLTKCALHQRKYLVFLFSPFVLARLARLVGLARLVLARNSHLFGHERALTLLQAFPGSSTIRPHQASSSQLRASKVPHNQHTDILEALGFDGSKNWPPGSATRLTVIRATKRTSNLVGKAIVRCLWIRGFSDVLHCLRNC